ncbi:MAG: hypothetical protein GDA54_01695 [Alphaproteobacteria bacterium GM7ARS4]|nr:hypothetical protein [Alphaproteobacteria bacterium GM7ARS4]
MTEFVAEIGGWDWSLISMELPALCGIAWLVWQVKGEQERGLARLAKDVEARIGALTEKWARSQMTLAQHYVRKEDMGQLEERLSRHLVRIEQRLDGEGRKNAKRRIKG